MTSAAQIPDVVTNVEYDVPLWERLCGIFVPAGITRVLSSDPEQLKQALDRAEIVVLSELMPPFQIRGIRPSGSTGYALEVLAEQAISFVLSLVYRFEDLFEAQYRSSFEKPGREKLRNLYENNVDPVGLGRTQKLGTIHRFKTAQTVRWPVSSGRETHVHAL